MPIFYGHTQVHSRERGYLRIAIPPHIIEEIDLKAGDKVMVMLEKQE